jgi:hypothetical protein
MVDNLREAIEAEDATGVKSFVYRDEVDIKKFYNEIIIPKTLDCEEREEGKEVISMKKMQEIYIPWDIMMIDEKEKGIVENDYHFRFYKNEYKRVVMWHLSQFHNVRFYISSK